jgi:hypothetical protein
MNSINDTHPTFVLKPVAVYILIIEKLSGYNVNQEKRVKKKNIKTLSLEKWWPQDSIVHTIK